MSLSPILALPYLMPAQAQKHVTHNEALQRLDALVQLRVAAIGSETPPADPSPGTAHVLGETPTGDWAGHAGQIAVWQGEGWLYLVPGPGWRVWDMATGTLRIWTGSDWVLPPAQADNLDHIGINTSGDAVNRLAVASEAVLFSHAGSSHQMKINKAGASDTAALLLQSDWSGRAELGLLGNEDFAIKLSGDGNAWESALCLHPGGRAGFGTETPAAHLEIRGTGPDDYLLAGDGTAQFRLGADGTGRCMGTWAGGGADYAEWFQWLDNNLDGADRRGISVVLEGERVRAARPGDEPIGIISAAPVILGEDDGLGWRGQYQRDGYGSVMRDETGQPKQVPGYDPSRPYLPRADRFEWAMVGLMGKLVLRPGQPVAARWIKLSDIRCPATGDRLERWLVR